MSRRVGLALVLLLGCRQQAPAPSTDSVVRGNGWNVLLITIDTLRADHLGLYGYRRNTSPEIDRLGARGAVFEQAYTYWPKTRGSFVVMFTGRYPSGNGYSKRQPRLLEFNPTLASLLRKAAYRTAAVVDNPNVASRLGYSKGFDSYRETWEERDLITEMDRTRTITAGGIGFIREQGRQGPFLLWLHYVNPHAPYAPPPPFDQAYLDPGAFHGPKLPTVAGFQGGIPERWAVAGREQLGYYVAQYDGEIATVDREVGEVLDALDSSGLAGRTLVVLTSDHGESLGEHDYYFDHGEDIYDPCLRVPLILALPGVAGGRRCHQLASTLDLVPTVLDAVKVSYPPGLDGVSLLPAVEGRPGAERDRLFSQNDRNLAGRYDGRYKIVATPLEEGRRFTLLDRLRDPSETRDVSRAMPDAAAGYRTVLERFLEQRDSEWARTRRLIGEEAPPPAMTAAACEKLRALNYILEECRP